jgi:hypothetical protein
VAATLMPITFQPTLMPRSPLDQALVTGISTGLNYGLAALTQDSIEALALQRALRPRPGERLSRGGARTAGWWVAATGLSGAVTGVLHEATGPPPRHPGPLGPGGAVRRRRPGRRRAGAGPARHERLYRPLGHLAALSLLGAGMYGLMRRVDRRIERGAEEVEAAYDAPPTRDPGSPDTRRQRTRCAAQRSSTGHRRAQSAVAMS